MCIVGGCNIGRGHDNRCCSVSQWLVRMRACAEVDLDSGSLYRHSNLGRHTHSESLANCEESDRQLCGSEDEA